MAIEFENTSVRTEITLWYAISGAPEMKHEVNKKVRRPFAAKFVFEDRDCKDLHVSGYVVRANGETSNKVEQINEIRIWSQQDWPDWLHDLYKIACSDYTEAMRR